jgi:CubicO group peptidase (beta-lactamase class C family)
MRPHLPILLCTALAGAYAVRGAAQQTVAVATPTTAAPSVPRLAPAGAVRPVEAALARAAAEGRFSGAALIAKDGRPVFQHAYGMADREHGIANTLETRFNLGSMNKMFTSVAIAQLVAQGKLSYQDPLSKYIPDFPTAAAARTIRIEHLLTHTSGLGSYFTDRFFRERPTTVAALLDIAREDTALAFEPGTRQQYSNTAFLVLGAVIEKVTGQDYYDYVRDHVFAPAGMTSSSWPSVAEPGRALEYEISPRTGGQPRADAIGRGSPAGGGVSTVGDMLRFSQALLSGRLVPLEYVRLITTPKPEVGSQRYGYGFGVIERPLHIVGHNGGKPGVFAQLDIYPEAGYTTVLLMNQGDGEPQGEFVELLRNAVRAMEGVAPPPSASGASIPLPDTPAGRAASALLETVRGGDSAAIRHFVAERMGERFQSRPWDRTLALFQRMRGDFGEGRVVAATPTDNGIRLVLAAPRGRFTLSLGVEPSPPYRIGEMSIEMGGDEGEGSGPGGPGRAGGAPAPAAGAQTSLPDTPAGRAAAALLETLRGGDTTAIRRFVAERMDAQFQARPLEQQIALFRRMKSDFGDGRITAVQPRENGIRVTIEAGAQAFTLSLGVEPTAPYRIDDLSVEGTGAGEASAAPAAALDADAQRLVVDSIARMLERVYPSADTGWGIGERLRSRERSGAYASLTAPAAFATAVTEDMRAVNGDRHLNLRAGGPRRGRGGGLDEDAERASNYGMVARVLEGGVGYLKLTGLSGSPNAPARLGELLRGLGDIRAMIIDLRGAPGGSAQMANAVISHFTAPNLPSLRVVNRSEGTDEVRKTLVQVAGPRRTEIPLYVLVDRGSASAAEDVPFVLQSLGRATIVGEKTAGAGRNNLLVPVGAGLTASISISRVSDPRTGREWELVGVKPDIEVAPDQALDAALRAARERISRSRS